MILRNVPIVLLGAAATTVLALAVEQTWRESTAQATAVVKPQIPQPELTSGDCVFKVKTDKPLYYAGQSPVIMVTATNTSNKPMHAAVWVTMTGTSPKSAGFRMMSLPSTLWTHEFAFSLPAGKTKFLIVPSNAKLAAGENVQIVLSDNDKSVLGADLPVKDKTK